MFIAGNRSDPMSGLNYAIRDTSQPDSAADVLLFGTIERRDAMLEEFRSGTATFSGEYRSEEHGGNWSNRIMWEPTGDTAEVEIVTNELRRATDVEKQRKLRELIVAKRQAERDLVTAHADLASVRAQLAEEKSREITDPTDERLTPIWRQAEEAAEEHGFCPEYDKLANSLGIPGRERLYRSVVTVTVDAYVYSTARFADDAAERAEQLFVERLEQLAQPYGGGSDGDITNVDTSRTEVEGTEIYS